MTKRKPVDEVKWGLAAKSGDYWRISSMFYSRSDARRSKLDDETVIRVRVTEVPKKKRSKK